MCIKLPKSCVNFIFLCKFDKEPRCFLEKITQLGKILHDRRSQRSRQFSPLMVPNLLPNGLLNPIGKKLEAAIGMAIETSIRLDRIAMVFNISQPLTKGSICTEYSGVVVGKCYCLIFIFVAPRVYNCQEFLLSIPPLLPSAITKLANNVVS